MTPGFDVGHRDRHVVNEELGFLDAENGVFRFRFACDTEAVEVLPSEVADGFEVGDTVKRILWSDGHVELVALQHRSGPRTLSVRSFPRKRRVRQGTTAADVEAPRDPRGGHSLSGAIVIVGGDCPTRYMEGLRHLGTDVFWHNGFAQREKLEQLLRRASVVITIETQVSHWAMWRIRDLAKANAFIWRQVKVKSLSSVAAAVMEAVEGAVPTNAAATVDAVERFA